MVQKTFIYLANVKEIVNFEKSICLPSFYFYIRSGIKILFSNYSHLDGFAMCSFWVFTFEDARKELISLLKIMVTY